MAVDADLFGTPILQKQNSPEIHFWVNSEPQILSPAATTESLMDIASDDVITDSLNIVKSSWERYKILEPQSSLRDSEPDWHASPANELVGYFRSSLNRTYLFVSYPKSLVMRSLFLGKQAGAFFSKSTF